MGPWFEEDAATHPAFPFLKCRAYVVHGYDDEAGVWCDEFEACFDPREIERRTVSNS